MKDTYNFIKYESHYYSSGSGYCGGLCDTDVIITKIKIENLDKYTDPEYLKYKEIMIKKKEEKKEEDKKRLHENNERIKVKNEKIRKKDKQKKQNKDKKICFSFLFGCSLILCAYLIKKYI